jgi:hypothetical protein
VSVLTGVEEPKLARDLTIRGVERIYYKPVNYKEFAIELRTLVEKRDATYAEIASLERSPEQSSIAEDLSNLSASPFNNEGQSGPSAADYISTGQNASDASSCDDRFPSRLSVPRNSNATTASRKTMISEQSAETSPGMLVSNAFAIKIDAELSHTKKALRELQHTVAAGETQSYFCLAIALGAGLIGGLFLGWISSQ